MRLSKYNQEIDLKNDGYFVYNFLSKSIVKFKDYLEYKDAINLDNEFLQCNNIIVADDVDEDIAAEMQFYDYVYDNVLRLVLLPNEECNFRCVFCYEKFSNVFMSEETICRIVKYLRKNITKYAGLNIDWFGGEPLLSVNQIVNFSIRAIELCSKAKIPYVAEMTTNGYLLDIDTFSLLLDLKIINYHITLCGLEEDHDAVRNLINGQGTFKKIINNLIQIKEKSARNAFKITIRINVTRSSLERLDKLILFLNDIFGGDDRFMFYFRPVGDWGGDSVKLIEAELNISKEEMFSQVFKVESKLNFDLYYRSLNTNLCAAAKRNSYVIRANGDLNKCTESLYSDYNYIGNISDNGDFNLNIANYLRWFYINYDNDKCNSCFKKLLCKNRKCPDVLHNNLNKSNCGYEDLSLEQVVLLLSRSNSRHIVKYKGVYDHDSKRYS